MGNFALVFPTCGYNGTEYVGMQPTRFHTIALCSASEPD